MRLVDSHCHLDSKEFDGDREEVLARARAAGLEALLAIGTGDGPPDLEAGLRLAERYPFVYATVGVHPHDAAKATGADHERLRELLRHPKAVALGETGLDYHYDFAPRPVQRAVFETQLRLAREAGKPVVIHTREAWVDTLAVLDRVPTIIHCFTGGPAEAEQALERGYHLAFGGVVTFPKAGSVREAARLTPDDLLLVETDCPYLAPVPYRGKRNEPAFVLQTVRKLAEIRGTAPERIAELSANNFKRLCLR